MITNKGKVLWANAIGDLRNGYAGTVKEIKETNKLVAAGGPKWAANQFVGQDVYSGTVAGTIVSNTETELVVARWENLPTAEHEGHNRSELGEPPVESAAFTIASGATPAAWVAVSADEAEPKATNETLKGEIKTAEGGLVRALATFKYLGGKEYEVKVTFTANPHDSGLPVTLAKIGIFNAQSGGIMMFESLLTATAEIKSVGDSVTITDVVTGS